MGGERKEVPKKKTIRYDSKKVKGGRRVAGRGRRGRIKNSIEKADRYGEGVGVIIKMTCVHG